MTIKIVAVERQTDGSFKLAVKNINTYGDTSETNWSIYTISDTGVLDWSSTWGGVAKQNQDLNDDDESEYPMHP